MRRLASHLDVGLLLCVLVLCSLSLAVIYSAGGENPSLLGRQAVRIGIGLAVMVAVAQVPPAVMARWAPWLFGAGLVLLAAVLVVGMAGKGAQRWLSLGVVRFQPAEVMKIAVPMMLAWLFSVRQVPPRWLDLLLAAVIVGVPCALVVVQPDLGTAVLIGASGLIVIFLAGIGWKRIVAAVLLVAAAAPVMWSFLHEYQQRRVLTLFDPWSDPLGAGYHSIQSIIAVGSGGVYGKGWLNGSQSQLEFIPERSTDFIFAVFAEEFGAAGSFALLALYLLMVGRGLYIAYSSSDTFARLLAGSLILTFFFYVFVNIGMVAGIVPVVGVPLPLISYGGTSMLTILAGFGILMAIHTHRRLITS